MATDHDSLRSKQNIRMLFAISEGEIEEISQIYLNEVPISSLYGDFAYTKGALGQPTISYFDAVGGTSSSPVEFKRWNVPPTSGNYFDDTNPTGTLNNLLTLDNFTADVEFVRIYFAFSSFYRHDAGGDYRETEFKCRVLSGLSTQTNDMLTTHHLSYDHSYIADTDIVKKGKSMGQYTLVVDVPRPNTVINSNDTWKVVLKKLSIDTIDGTDKQDYYSITCNVTAQPYYNTYKTNYAGTALLAIAVEDATRVNNSFPNVSAKGKGMKLKVPTTYNTTTRTHTGNWNGKFKPTYEYTNNYAWCLYNIVSDSLKKRIPITTNYTSSNAADFVDVTIGCGVPEEYMAKYNFDTFSKYCDEDVHIQYTKLNYISTITYSSILNKVIITTTIPHGLTNANKLAVQDIGFNYDISNATIDVPTSTTIQYTPIATPTQNTAYTNVGSVVSSVGVYFYLTEKRYSLNGQFLERKDAESFLNDILTIGNCYLAEIDGLINVIYDYPLTTSEIDATPLFTNQNVDNGIFEYSDSSIADNHTQINVTIQDIDNYNRTKTVAVFANDLKDFLNSSNLLPYYETNITAGSLPINYFEDKFELNVFDITMQGTTSTSAAYRKGRSLLWDALMNNEIVSFKTLIAGSNLYKGQVIRIADTDLMGSMGVITGRIIKQVGNTITFDREVTFVANTPYSLYIYFENSENIETILSVNPVNSTATTIYATSAANSTTATLHDIDTTDLKVGDFITVVDNSASLSAESVPILSINTTTHTATYTITPQSFAMSSNVEVGKQIKFIQKKPTKLTYTPTTTTSVTSLTLGSIASRVCILDSIFVLKTNTIQTYKVISTTKDEDLYTTSCVRYDLKKFDYIDVSIIDKTTDLAHITYTAPTVLNTDNIQDNVNIYATISNSTNGKLNANLTIMWADNVNVTNLLIETPYLMYSYSIDYTVNGIEYPRVITSRKEANISVEIPSDATSIVFIFNLSILSPLILMFNDVLKTANKQFTWTLDVPATIASSMIEH